jgi:hypothetical protein
MLWRILKWVVGIIVVGYVLLVVYRIFAIGEEEKTVREVEKIHNARIELRDVMGDNLPPAPENPDATVAGVDANTNGIRDDVELAIFKEYPSSARTRAVLLQYAHALQLEVTQDLVNTGTVVAVAQVGSKASKCVGKFVPRENLQEFARITQTYTDFVTKKQINTPERDEAQKRFYEKIDSYASLEDEACDIDFSTLPN